MKKLALGAAFPLSRIIQAYKFVILLSVGIALITFAFLFRVVAQTETEPAGNPEDNGTDMLAYVSNDGNLMLYNPRQRTETTLLTRVQNFVLGQKGRIAFTKQAENDPDLYVFDPATPAVMPIKISAGLAAYNVPVGWSPDERYLAFDSYADSEDHFLYVWDGKTAIKVMPDKGLGAVVRFYINWSYDDRLAFTTQYGWSNLDVPPESYLWDGSATMNLSQNPDGWDGSSVWSKTGQLLFGSDRNEESGIYVWDGVTFKDGVPDQMSFTRLAPEFNPGHIIWAGDDYVGFTTTSDASASGTKEIVLWDLAHEAVVKRFPISSRNSVSWLAEGGRMILSSQLVSGIPSYDLDVENTKGDILLSIETGEIGWSADGYLAFCGIEDGISRVLSIWNGQESWVVARVRYKPVRWQHGQATFSCNNG